MVKEITAAENEVWVSLYGSIYIAEAAQLREDLIGYIEKEPKTFIIDLENVDYIDSTGLGTLLHIRKRARQKGGSVIIKGLHGFVKEIFELTHLTKVFEIQ